MKIRTRPSLCVWIFTFAYQTISTYRQRRRGGLARPGSWARRGRQCRVCKLWGKGWGLCKQVFMSRSEDLPITVCPSFYPFLICQSAGTDFLIFNIWSRLHACFLLLTEPTNLILMADRSGACLMLVLIFITRHCQLILTHGPWSSPSHLITPLLSREGFLCLLNPESDDPAMIREAGEWSLVNDSQFPAPHSLSSFSPQIPDIEISDLVSCRNPSILPSIKRTLTRSLSGLCQNKQLEHWLATCIVNIWGNQTSGKNESWSLVIDVSAGGRGADGIWYAASSSPPPGCHCELCECRNIWK